MKHYRESKKRGNAQLKFAIRLKIVLMVEQEKWLGKASNRDRRREIIAVAVERCDK